MSQRNSVISNGAALVVAPGIVARVGSYAPRSSLTCHEHTWSYFSLVLDGTVHEGWRSERAARTSGEVRVMPSQTPHSSIYRADGARTFVVELHRDLQPELSTHIAQVRAFPRQSDVSRLATRMYDEYRKADDLSSLVIDGLIREFVASVARSSRGDGANEPAPAWIRRVRDRLHDGFPNAPSLAKLADESGMHPSHVVRTFRKHFQTSPGEYVATLRIRRACDLLAGSGKPIAVIALEAGFSDQAHLTRRFRATMGTTPARYRAAHGL